jgi:hypothetical protein
MIDHRAEADAGVIFGEDGFTVLDPDGRVIFLAPTYRIVFVEDTDQ